MAPPKPSYPRSTLSKIIKAQKPNKKIGPNLDKIAYVALLSFLQRTAQETRIVAQETYGGDGGRKMSRKEIGRAGRRVIRRISLQTNPNRTQ
ncbi:hypothetical protein WALSEDRAFT_68357, partial [Wallemia mellicola CBS 633.66]